MLVLLGACRSEARRSTPAQPARDEPPAAPVAPDAAPPRCGPRFADDDLAALPSAAVPELACDGATVVARWRAQGADAWATHPLRDGARWETGTFAPSPPPLGVSVLAEGGVGYALTLGRDLSLTLHGGEGMAERARVMLGPSGLREPSFPRLLRVRGDRVLALMNARVSGREREVWLVAFGGGATAVSSLGPGSLGPSHVGARSLVTAVVTNPDRTVSLRGRWLDVEAAMTSLRVGRVTLTGEWLTDASIPLPHRGMEFSPDASDGGALLAQAVLGAERGAASYVRFSPEGRAEDVFFGAIPSALGDVVRDGATHAAYWWDERYRARVRVYGAGEPRELPKGESVGDAFAALRAARGVRHLRCGDGVWRVRVAGGAMRLARDCP